MIHQDPLHIYIYTYIYTIFELRYTYTLIRVFIYSIFATFGLGVCISLSFLFGHPRWIVFFSSKSSCSQMISKLPIASKLHLHMKQSHFPVISGIHFGEVLIYEVTEEERSVIISSHLRMMGFPPQILMNLSCLATRANNFLEYVSKFEDLTVKDWS